MLSGKLKPQFGYRWAHLYALFSHREFLFQCNNPLGEERVTHKAICLFGHVCIITNTLGLENHYSIPHTMWMWFTFAAIGHIWPPKPDSKIYVSLSLPYLRCAPRIVDGARYENPRFPIDDDSAMIITYISRTIIQGVKDIKSIGPSTSKGTKWNAKCEKAQHTNK